MHNEVKSETVSKSDMVEVSHFSMATIGEQEQLCAMGGGLEVVKGMKQVYFIGGGSGMDLVHSTAWER